MRTTICYYTRLLTAMILCTFSFLLLEAQDTTFHIDNGIVDLRKADFGRGVVQVEGDCRFAWKQLVTPQQTNLLTDYIRFPQLWNDATVHGEKLSACGYGTYGLTILLPKNTRPLAITMPMVYCAYRLFLNGNEAAANGRPAETAAGYSPKWVPVTVSIPPATDTLQLLLQVANYSHFKGGANLSIGVGEAASLFLQKERIITSDFLLSGCLFMGGLFFLGLYFFGTRDKATLYFSLFCILYSYRLVGSGYYSLHAAFPNLNWELTVRLEYFSLYGSMLLFFQYLRHLYPKDIHEKLVWVVSAACALLCISTLTLPAILFTRLLIGFLLLAFLCIAYMSFVFTRAYLNRRIAAGYALTSVIVMLAIQLVVELEYFGVAVPSRVMLFAGYVIFFFLQSLILSFRFAYDLQEAKRQAEQGLHAKSEFLSTMSHEIRTPLNSVIGMSNLMLRNNPRPDQKEQLDVLQFSAKNLLSIVNDILDYNKIEAGKISFEEIPIDLPAILHNIVTGAKDAAHEKGILVNLQLDEAVDSYVLGDPTRLSQVLHNLVGNAVKFTQRGAVSVDLSVLEARPGAVTLVFSVKDTGIGIPKEKQELIFEQFTQADSSTSRSFGGTGLGLAISRKILALQGSKLQLTSEPGKGSTFYFAQTFKTTDKKLQKKNSDSGLNGENEHPLSGVRILLVEDNQINVLVAKNFLENWGATIDVAENGQEAVDMLDPDKHHIILMDLHMPVMDGYTAIRTIRGKGISVPIIALTASLPNEVEAEIKGLDINGFVLKPFAPDELFQKVQLLTSGKAELIS